MSPGSAAIVEASTQLIRGTVSSKGDVAVVGAEPAELALASCDLAVELVDQAQAGLDRCLPRLRQAESGEQLAAAGGNEIGDRAWPAVREQDGVHALLQTGAVADEVQSPAGPLALGAHERIG